MVEEKNITKFLFPSIKTKILLHFAKKPGSSATAESGMLIVENISGKSSKLLALNLMKSYLLESAVQRRDCLSWMSRSVIL